MKQIIVLKSIPYAFNSKLKSQSSMYLKTNLKCIQGQLIYIPSPLYNDHFPLMKKAHVTKVTASPVIELNFLIYIATQLTNK